VRRPDIVNDLITCCTEHRRPLEPHLTPSPTSPLARSGLVTSLTQEIAALIRREHLRPGDRLPTVRALAARFDVAVPTVREALQRLEAIGLIQVRHGSGIFVRAEQPRMMFAQPGRAIVDGQVISDLIQTRLLIEPYLAEHAALASPGDQVARLAELLQRAAGLLDGGHDHELRQANMAFHVGIARCAGNLVLTQVMELLVELYASEQTAMLAIADDRRRDHEEHLAILGAIQAGDAELARSLMQRHLEVVRDLVTARLAAAAHARKVVWLNAAGGANQR
jgi:GntR family transcriptional regulator, transcriptional repressor for pyruvate dehydrogenase complex